MNRPVFLLLLVLIFGSACAAQSSSPDQPATKEDIERYLDLMHTRDLMKSMMSSLTTQMHQVLHDQLAKTPGLPPDAEAEIDKMMDDSLSNFPVDDLIQAEIPVYQKYFTKSDIEALTAFYSTPTGQKIIAEMPAVTADSMKASSAIAEKMMGDAMQRVQDDIAQMQKQNESNPPAEGGPSRN